MVQGVDSVEQQPTQARFANFLSSLFGSTPVANREALQTQTALQQKQLEGLAQTQEGRNALAQILGPAAQDPAGLAQLQFSEANLRQADALTQQREQAAQTAETERRRQSLLNATLMLRNPIQRAVKAGATPGQLAEIFDSVAPLLQQMDPSLTPEVLAQNRSQIAENPNILDDIISALSPRQSTGGGTQLVRTREGVFAIPAGSTQAVPVTDERGQRLVDASVLQADARLEQGAERLEQGTERLVVSAARANIAQSVEQRRRQAFLEESETAARKTQTRLDNIQRVSNFVLRDANTAFELIDQSILTQERQTELGNVMAGVGARISELLPRSTVNSLSRQLSTIKSNIAIDQLLDIKREEASLGQVPQSQLLLLSELLGDLNVDTRPAILRQNLNDAIALYSNIVEEAAKEGLDLQARNTERREALNPPAGSDTSAAPIFRISADGTVEVQQ